MKSARVWMLVLLAACDGGSSGTPDAAVPDADADADAGQMGLDPLGDEDSDGVMNGVDVCPLVVDPAQVDLDNDGVGWMCDSLEETASPPSGTYRAIGVGGYTMSYGLDDEVLTVGPAGMVRSQPAADAWLSSGPRHPFVAYENRALWSLGDGSIGDLALPSGTFTSVSSGTFSVPFWHKVLHRRRGTFIVIPTDDGRKFLSPRPDGSVVTIASAASMFLSPVMVGSTTPRFVFADPEGTYVHEYIEGAASSQPIVVGATTLSGGADARAMFAAVQAGSAGLEKHLGFCISKGGKRYIVETHSNQVTAYETPMASCALSLKMSDDHRVKLFWSDTEAWYSVDGVFHSLPAAHWTLSGATLPVVVARTNGGVNDVRVVDSSGEHPLTVESVDPRVTQGGATTHFVASRGSTKVLVRYRNEVASEVALPDRPIGENWTAYTTSQGAAIVSTRYTAYVWPSQAVSGAIENFANVDVLVRGTRTVFVSRIVEPSVKMALYGYTEAGGVPQYTDLTPVVTEPILAIAVRSHSLGDEPIPTDWFVFEMAQGYCKLVRVIETAGIPSLQEGGPCSTQVYGTTPDGSWLLRVDNGGLAEIWKTDWNNFTKVATNHQFFNLLFASFDSSLILGWTASATVDVGGESVEGSFVCSASQPDRCWWAAGFVQESSWAPLDPANPDKVHLVIKSSAPNMLTSIKMIDGGNFPQPL